METSSSQKFLRLVLPAQGSFQLDDLLKRHFAFQQQADLRQCIQCEASNPFSPRYQSTERCKITEYPEYLLIQLLRNTFEGGKTVKNSSPVHFPGTEQVLVDNCPYQIIGTISHIGTAEAGHNRAYIRRKKTWFCCEDARHPFQKQPLDSEFEQNYCILLKKNDVPLTRASQIIKQPIAKDRTNCPSKIDETSENTATMNMKRSRSNESCSSTELPDNQRKTCMGCDKSFMRLLGHLRQSDCKSYYNMDELEQELKKEKNRKAIRNYRERQRSPSLKEKESKGRQERRAAEMKVDPNSFKEKRSLAQQEWRKTKIKEDPNGYREKESVGRQKRREAVMKEDPDGYREKESVTRQERREAEMKEDPDGYREKESVRRQIGRAHV